MGQPVPAGFPGHPGADRTGAIADQTGQMVGGPALAGFNHDGGLQAQTKPQEVVVDSPNGQ